MQAEPMQFIGEPIEVHFEKPPALEKAPTAPSSFTWGKKTYTIVSILAEWKDFERRGRMGRNMRPHNLRKAQLRGSWGVGRYYFRVAVISGEIFDIYYDRAPLSTSQRKGSWHIFRKRNTDLDVKAADHAPSK